MRKTHPFEIILVISVLVILAWLMLPRLSPPRSGRRPGCLNNVKQIGLALKQYSQDFANRYPWSVGVSDPEQAWRDLALLFPSYNSGWDSFRCPSSKDRPFRPMSASGYKKDYPFEPLLPADNTEVISYAYGIDARDPARPAAWTEEAPSTTRLAADKKAGISLTKRSNHKTDGRNVFYQDGHVKWKAGKNALDPDEASPSGEGDDAVGNPGATDYTAWWSDPPYYGER